MYKQVVAAFMQRHHFEPPFWLDKACVDQENIADGLRILPVSVIAWSTVKHLASFVFTFRDMVSDLMLPDVTPSEQHNGTRGSASCRLRSRCAFCVLLILLLFRVGETLLSRPRILLLADCVSLACCLELVPCS